MAIAHYRFATTTRQQGRVCYRDAVTDLEIICTLWNFHHSLPPLVSLVAKDIKQLPVTWIPAIIDLKVSNVRTPHVIPELECTRFTSLPEEWTDQVCVGKEACAIGYFRVHIVTWNISAGMVLSICIHACVQCFTKPANKSKSLQFSFPHS